MSRLNTAKSRVNNQRSLEEELEHQIKKSDLLDKDRYNFYHKAEETKKKNNMIIDQMRKENKELKKLRDDLQGVKKTNTNMNKTNSSGMMGSEGRDDKYWRRKLDGAQHSTKQLQSRLENLQDKLNEVTDNKFGLHDESQLMRNIRILENRLDKVMIKFNEAQSIKKTYEQIVKRLKEERVGYDNQLAAIERSLKGKERDFEELLLLAHDATHAKELAQAELKKYEHKKAAVRELRTTYIDEKKRQIEAREEAISRIEKREQDNYNSNVNNENSKVQSNMNPIQNLNNQDIQITQDVSMNKQKLKDYQEAFRRLYEATGVADVNEIIQKFTTQEETSRSLKDLKQEYTEKIEYLASERQKLKEELNKLKYGGGETLTRKQIDEFENNVNNAVYKCERNRLKYERISKILVNVKAGVEHLVEKTEFYRLDGKTNIVVSNETMIECLIQTVEKMKQIFQVVKNDPHFDEGQFRHDGKTIAYNKMPFNLNLFDKNAKIEKIQKNIRVPLMDKDDDDVSDADLDEDLDIEANIKFKQKYDIKNKMDKSIKSKKK